MSFGMRIWGPTGKLELDENSFTVRIVYSAVVAFITGGNRYINISIPGISPATHSAVCIPIGAYPQDPNAQNNYAIQYEPDVYIGGVTVWFGNRAAPFNAINGLGPQRLLVMKDR
ncbi:MAG TPA: hypothetical protein DIW86_00260 [Pseudomonas sp.]|jgi:hypothetical protein|nr:hypothetical protein [Pseudomonas sp.]